MPFTLAHAAAALPFRRMNLAWSAFLVGSMAPDFPYVVGNIEYRALGHDFPGLLFFTLPVSFVALWFFHLAIKRPATGLLPVGMQRRLVSELGDFHFGGVRRVLTISFSIILGITTHLVWDSFTHSRTWAWRHVAWLQSWMDLPVAGPIPTVMFLQYASTLLGFLSLGAWLLLWYLRTPPVGNVASLPAHKSRAPLAAILFAIAIATGLLRAWNLIGMAPPTAHNWDWFMLNFAATAIAVGFWEVLFYCLIVTSREILRQPAKLGVM